MTLSAGAIGERNDHFRFLPDSFKRSWREFIQFVVLGLAATTGFAAPVALQNDTATFSQTTGGSWLVSDTTDGNLGDGNGWAIYENPGTSAQVAVWETASDLGYVAGTTLTFTLTMNYSSDAEHTLGRFRLSYTTDARTEFADGLSSGGDVTANWTVMVPTSQGSSGGTTLIVQGDNSILATGSSPATDVYTVTADIGAVTGITGFRLEVMEDASLPFNGPGREPTNGNFVLTELEIDEVELPVTLQSLSVE